MTADRLTAGKTGNGLVDNRLENGGRQVFLGGSFVDEGLDICLGKYTTSGCDRVDRLVILGIFVQTGGICLDQRSHLVDKGTGTTGTDTVHTLFYVTVFKVDDLGILTTKFNGNVCLWCIVGQGSRDCDNLLDKINAQMLGKCQTAGTGDHRRYHDLAGAVKCFM